jgi:nitrogen regulatory protein P-II 2
MRLVIAVLKPSQLEVVREALAAVHVTRLTVCDAQGYDDPRGPGPIVQQTVIEVAVNEDFVDRAVDAITAAIGPTDAPEPRIFVVPIAEAVQLYREVRGPEAV